MVRETKCVFVNEGGNYYREFAGLKTDTKPTEGVTTGSLFLEVDTGDVYAYEEVGEQWHKIAALGGE